MTSNVGPLRAEKFLKAAFEYMEPFRVLFIYGAMVRDFMQKTGKVDAGYGRWLKQMLEFVVQKYNLKERKILDFGCGTGKLTVQMRCFGYETYGLDIHQKHLELAKILAVENGLNEEMFILNYPNSKKLPFADNAFDLVTMFSVIEHLDNNVLKWLLVELKRVCQGVVYVLAPNRLKLVDDHTGLKFVPWIPRQMAIIYVKMWERKHRYFISLDQSWDVHYRSFSRIVSLFHRYGFILDFPLDEVVYPPNPKPITRIGKNLTIGSKKIFIGIPLSYDIIDKTRPPETGILSIPEPNIHSTKGG